MLVPIVEIGLSSEDVEDEDGNILTVSIVVAVDVAVDVAVALAVIIRIGLSKQGNVLIKTFLSSNGISGSLIIPPRIL